MDVKRTDRRVSRTRKVLRESLMALILEKGYEAVTVEEITSRADVGRTTFYLHYKDKEELFLESINAIVDDLVAQISILPPLTWYLPESGGILAPHAPILLVFQHAAEHADLYQIMLRGEGGSRTQIKIGEILAGAVHEILDERMKGEPGVPQPGVPVDVFCNYFAGSLVGITTWWLEANMPYPPDEMAVMFQKLVYPGILEVFRTP